MQMPKDQDKCLKLASSPEFVAAYHTPAACTVCADAQDQINIRDMRIEELEAQIRELETRPAEPWDLVAGA
jgi:hypothetical protein